MLGPSWSKLKQCCEGPAAVSERFEGESYTDTDLEAERVEMADEVAFNERLFNNILNERGVYGEADTDASTVAE